MSCLAAKLVCALFFFEDVEVTCAKGKYKDFFITDRVSASRATVLFSYARVLQLVCILRIIRSLCLCRKTRKRLQVIVRNFSFDRYRCVHGRTGF